MDKYEHIDTKWLNSKVGTRVRITQPGKRFNDVGVVRGVTSTKGGALLVDFGHDWTWFRLTHCETALAVHVEIPLGVLIEPIDD